MKWAIQTQQEFSVTYVVEADTKEEAWEALITDFSDHENDDASPGEITGSFDSSDFEEIP